MTKITNLIEQENKRRFKLFVEIIKKDLKEFKIPTERLITEKDIRKFFLGRHKGGGRKAYKVRQINATTGKLIRIFSSAREAARQMGVSNTSIDRAINGKNLTCSGFKWERDD